MSGGPGLTISCLLEPQGHLVSRFAVKSQTQQTSHTSHLHEGLPSTCVRPWGLGGGGGRRALVVPGRPQCPDFPAGVARLTRGCPCARWTDTGSCSRPLEGTVEIPDSWSVGGDPESSSGFPGDIGTPSLWLAVPALPGPKLVFSRLTTQVSGKMLK